MSYNIKLQRNMILTRQSGQLIWQDADEAQPIKLTEKEVCRILSSLSLEPGEKVLLVHVDD